VNFDLIQANLNQSVGTLISLVVVVKPAEVILFRHFQVEVDGGLKGRVPNQK
jgi:hypothetical protein